MILVDTSVWIRYLTNRQPYRAELERLLRRDEVLGHELVYGELIVGDRGGRRIILADYENMHQIRLVPHEQVVEFVRDRDLQGRGVGWIDVHLLASALVAHAQLWTADPRFSVMADEFGIGYKVPASRPREQM
jgi:predicted nucleic acid-binding protein